MERIQNTEQKSKILTVLLRRGASPLAMKTGILMFPKGTKPLMCESCQMNSILIFIEESRIKNVVRHKEFSCVFKSGSLWQLLFVDLERGIRYVGRFLYRKFVFSLFSQPLNT